MTCSAPHQCHSFSGPQLEDGFDHRPGRRVGIRSSRGSSDYAVESEIHRCDGFGAGGRRGAHGSAATGTLPQNHYAQAHFTLTMRFKEPVRPQSSARESHPNIHSHCGRDMGPRTSNHGSLRGESLLWQLSRWSWCRWPTTGMHREAHSFVTFGSRGQLVCRRRPQTPHGGTNKRDTRCRLGWQLAHVAPRWHWKNSFSLPPVPSPTHSLSSPLFSSSC